MDRDEVDAFAALERRGWEARAVDYRRHWGALTGQAIGPTLDAAGVGAGTEVLDMACGDGSMAAAARDRGARAIGVDFSAAQVALARRVHPEIVFEQASADALPFADASFDAVVMGFGMLHMPDPERAAREAARVLRPGGFVAFTVWTPAEPGGLHARILGAIERHALPVQDLPRAPAIFRYADPGEAAGLALAAGLAEPASQRLPLAWPAGPEDLLQAIAEGTVRTSLVLAAQSPERLAAIRREALAGGPAAAVIPAMLNCARKPVRRA
jgi:SAM-dependent methyltransferase